MHFRWVPRPVGRASRGEFPFRCGSLAKDVAISAISRRGCSSLRLSPHLRETDGKPRQSIEKNELPTRFHRTWIRRSTTSIQTAINSVLSFRPRERFSLRYKFQCGCFSDRRRRPLPRHLVPTSPARFFRKPADTDLPNTWKINRLASGPCEMTDGINCYDYF